MLISLIFPKFYRFDPRIDLRIGVTRWGSENFIKFNALINTAVNDARADKACRGAIRMRMRAGGRLTKGGT